MTDLFIIDTHTLLWNMDDSPRLSARVRQIFNESSVRFIVPTIVLAEALFIIERKRTAVTVSEYELLDSIERDSRIEVFALDEKTVSATLNCREIPEIHDRLIVATASLLQDEGFEVAILTKDSRIQNSGLISTIW